RPYILQRARKLKTRIQLIRTLDNFFRHLSNRIIARDARCLRRRIRNLLAKVARDHRECSAREIAEIIRQIGVVPLHQSVKRETAVLAKDYFPKQEITESIVAENINDSFGANDIAARLRHLVLLEQQPAMDDDLLRQWQACSHEKRGPIHSVEANYLLAHHVNVGWPVALELLLCFCVLRAVADCRDVVRVGIE